MLECIFQIMGLAFLLLIFSAGSGLILWLSTIMFHVEGRSYFKAFKINLFSLWPSFLYSFLCDCFQMDKNRDVFRLFGFYGFDLFLIISILISVILSLFFINKYYSESKSRSFLIWISWLLATIVLLMFVAFVLVILAAGISM